MNGITFGDLHSYRDLSLILKSKQIGTPAPKIKTIDIPGGDGVIDATEFFGEVKYQNRSLIFEFSTVVPKAQFMTLFGTVQNLLHGQRMKIALDEDPDWYYIGRISVSEWKADKNIGRLTIECDCEPFKYRLSSQTVYLYGKNIFDTGNVEQGVLNATMGKIWDELTAYTTVTRLRSKTPFPIKPNMQYTFSFPHTAFKTAIRQFDKNSVLIASTGWNTNTVTFKTLDATKTLGIYIAFLDDATVLPSDVADLEFQIEEGNAATAFEAFDAVQKIVEATFGNTRKPAVPSAYVTGGVTVESDSVFVTLQPGKQLLDSFTFHQGNNTLTFKGNGAAIVEWLERGL